METFNKDNYEAPSILVVEVKSERVICGSQLYDGFGNEEDM